MAAQPPESRIERANWSKLPVSELKATLIYDGACGVCRWWVGYWQQLTGGQVLYRAYQEAADDFPEIPRDALARAIGSPSQTVRGARQRRPRFNS